MLNAVVEILSARVSGIFTLIWNKLVTDAITLAEQADTQGGKRQKSRELNSAFCKYRIVLRGRGKSGLRGKKERTLD
jgi:hypothetical protein